MDWRDALKDISLRLKDLDRRMVKHRQGEITDTTPLTVKLGGADTPYTNVRTLSGVGFAVGDVVSVLTFGNDCLVLGAITATGKVPHARVAKTADQAIASATAQFLSFDTTLYDEGGMHGTADRLTAPLDGLYSITGHVALNAAVANQRLRLDLIANAATFIGAGHIPVGAFEDSVHTEWRLAAGEYVRLQVSNLTTVGVTVSDAFTPVHLAMTWLGA